MPKKKSTGTPVHPTVICYSSSEPDLRWLAQWDDTDAIWVDVRAFRDPEGRTSHDGRHAEVMIPFVDHPRFPELIAEVKAICNEKLALDASLVSLCFWCHHGKHRSVCAADLFGNLLYQKLGAKEIRFHHLTQQYRNSTAVLAPEAPQGSESIF